MLIYSLEHISWQMVMLLLPPVRVRSLLHVFNHLLLIRGKIVIFQPATTPVLHQVLPVFLIPNPKQPPSCRDHLPALTLKIRFLYHCLLLSAEALSHI